ncbi:hypothetical protein JXA80_01115 [bacterium]|nr:hypothetical protein [candidate division CSSED10-310 bacterium]
MRTITRFYVIAWWIMIAGIGTGNALEDPCSGWTSTTQSVGSIQNVSCGWSSDDTVWVYGGGITGWYRSDDEGLTWEHRDTDPLDTSDAGNYFRIFASPGESGLLYAGSYGNTIRVSENNGDTWTALETPVTVEMITGLVNPLNPREAFIGLADQGIARLRHTGSAWEITLSNVDDSVYDMVMDPADTNTIYLATAHHGISRLVRLIGDDWIFHSDGQNPVATITAICIDPDTPDTLYAGSNRDNGGTIWKGDGSIDGRFTWIELPPFYPDWRIDTLVCPSTGDFDLIAASNGRLYAFRESTGTWTPMVTPIREGNRVFSMTESSKTGNILLGTDSGCYAFLPALNTWQIRNHGLRNVCVNKILVHPSNPFSMVMATEGNGVFTSRDAGQIWMACNPGLTNLFIRDITRDPLAPDRLYAAHLRGFARSDDGGVSWTQPWAEELQAERIVACVQNNQTVLLLSHRDSSNPTTATIYRSVNHGDTWVPVSVPVNTRDIRELVVHPINPSTIYACSESSGSWISTTYGLSFDPWTPTGLPQSCIRLVINPLNQQTLFACGANAVYRSVDGGNSFSLCSGTSGRRWLELAIDPANPDRIMICGDSPIYNPPGMKESIDGGGTFNEVPDFPQGRALPCLMTDFDDNRIFLFDMRGNQYAFDFGTGSWNPRNNHYIQLPYTVTDYEIDPFDPHTIYAATHGDGIWRSEDSGWTWHSVSTGLEDYPFVFSLEADARQRGRFLAGASQSGFTMHTLFQTVDSGVDWVILGNPPVNREIVDIDIVDDPVAQEDIWIATYGDGVFISHNNGSDWESRMIVPMPPGNFITSVTHTYYGSQEEPWIHVASHGGEGAFVFDPDDRVFVPNNTGLPRDSSTGFIFIDRIFSDPSVPGTLFATIPDGTLYKTVNNGALWLIERSGRTESISLHRCGINQVRDRYSVPPFRQSDLIRIGDIIVHGSVMYGVMYQSPGTQWCEAPPVGLTPESWAFNYSLGAVLNSEAWTVLMGTTMVESPHPLAEQFSITLTSPMLDNLCKKTRGDGF